MKMVSFAGHVSPGGNVSQRTVDREECELPDRPLVTLGEGDERFRVDSAATGVFPPGKCFEGDDPTGPSVRDRLVMKDHLPELHRPAKLGAPQDVPRVAIAERTVGVDPGQQAQQEEHRRFVDLLDSTGVALRERPDEQHDRGHARPEKPAPNSVHHPEKRDRNDGQQHDSRVGHLEAQDRDADEHADRRRIEQHRSRHENSDDHLARLSPAR